MQSLDRVGNVMLEFEGQHAVTSSTGTRALIGAFEKSVVVCDLDTGGISRRLETTFDFGGERLALSDQLDGVVAGAYKAPGLAFYCCATGRERWRRKDLKRVQHVSLSRDGLSVFCGREGASLAVVDLETGEIRHSMRGVRALHEGNFEPVRFLDADKPQIQHLNGKRLFFIQRTTFAFLDVLLAPGVVVLSESGGPVRCIDVETGRERWRYEPKAGRHVLNLGFRQKDSSVLGIEWPYENGGAKTLICWSLSNGASSDRLVLGQPADCCFGLGGNLVVLSDGRILPTPSV